MPAVCQSCPVSGRAVNALYTGEKWQRLLPSSVSHSYRISNITIIATYSGEYILQCVGRLKDSCCLPSMVCGCLPVVLAVLGGLEGVEHLARGCLLSMNLPCRARISQEGACIREADATA